MPTSFKFYHDSALTSEITTGNPLTATQDTANVLADVDKTIYFGSTLTGNKVQSNVSPGVNQIVLSVIDANNTTGSPTTEFKLALSSGALATATAGASLNLGLTVNSGAANAVPVFTRRNSVLAVAGTYTDITLETNVLIESPI